MMRIKFLFSAALFLAGATHLAAQGPGALESVHPSYDLTTMRPNGFEPSISGIDFLSDGRAVITTYPFTAHNYRVNSKVYILEGLTGNNPQDVNPIEVPLNFTDAMDPLVVDDEIYIMERNFFSRLVDSNNDGVPDEKDVIYTGWINQDRSWTFDVEHYDGNFYLAMGVAMPNAQPTRSTESDLRGCLMRITPNGQADCIAWGLRQPNGLAITEDGDFFFTDNQGQWLPANKFSQVVPGRYYGCEPSSNGNLPETPPSLWLTQLDIAMSPTKPIQVKSGIYAGQWLFGDVSYGGIQRAYLEKINGEYQGAVFRFTGGLEAGINEVEIGPDGNIYAAGLGNGSATDNWGLYRSTTGLQRLAFNGDTTFEVLSIRSSNNGFAVDFTKPVSAAAANPSNYEMEMYWFRPLSSYGGPKMDPDSYNTGSPRSGTRNLTVQNATLSGDRTVLLEVPNLMDDAMVVYFNFDAIRSQSGESLWDAEAWYTLHNFGPEIVDVVKPTASKKDLHIISRLSERALHFEVEGLSKGNYELRNFRGQLAASGKFSEGRFTLPREGLTGAYFIKVKSNQYSSTKKLALY